MMLFRAFVLAVAGVPVVACNWPTGCLAVRLQSAKSADRRLLKQQESESSSSPDDVAFENLSSAPAPDNLKFPKGREALGIFPDLGPGLGPGLDGPGLGGPGLGGPGLGGPGVVVLDGGRPYPRPLIEGPKPDFTPGSADDPTSYKPVPHKVPLPHAVDPHFKSIEDENQYDEYGVECEYDKQSTRDARYRERPAPYHHRKICPPQNEGWKVTKASRKIGLGHSVRHRVRNNRWKPLSRPLFREPHLPGLFAFGDMMALIAARGRARP